MKPWDLDKVRVRKYVPLSDIQGVELMDDSWLYPEQEEYAAGQLVRDDIVDEEMARNAEMAAGEVENEAPDMEAAQAREQAILEQLQQIMAEQATHSIGVMDREGMALSMLDQAFAAPQMQTPTRQFPMNVPEQPKQQSFSQAFAAARKAGLKQFDWRGKKYTTQLAKKPWRPMRDR